MDEIKHKSFFVVLCVALLGFYGVCYLITKDGYGTAPAPATVTTNANTTNPQYSFYVGQNLYDSDGELFGRIVEISQSHVFGNGAVEPGVLLTFRDRPGMERTDLSWLPMRSASLMVNQNAQ